MPELHSARGWIQASDTVEPAGSGDAVLGVLDGTLAWATGSVQVDTGAPPGPARRGRTTAWTMDLTVEPAAGEEGTAWTFELAARVDGVLVWAETQGNVHTKTWYGYDFFWNWFRVPGTSPLILPGINAILTCVPLPDVRVEASVEELGDAPLLAPVQVRALDGVASGRPLVTLRSETTTAMGRSATRTWFHLSDRSPPARFRVVAGKTYRLRLEVHAACGILHPGRSSSQFLGEAPHHAEASARLYLNDRPELHAVAPALDPAPLVADGVMPANGLGAFVRFVPTELPPDPPKAGVVQPPPGGWSWPEDAPSFWGPVELGRGRGGDRRR